MPIALLNKTDLTPDEITEFLSGIDKELSNVGGEGAHRNEYEAFKAAIANFTQWRIEELGNIKTHPTPLAQNVKDDKKTQIEADAGFEDGEFEGEVQKFLDFKKNISDLINGDDNSEKGSAREGAIKESLKFFTKNKTPGNRPETPTISDGIFANFLVQSFYDKSEGEKVFDFSERLRNEVRKTTVVPYENPIRELAYKVYKDNTARYGVVWESAREKRGPISDLAKRLGVAYQDRKKIKGAKLQQQERAAGLVQKNVRGMLGRKRVEGIKIDKLGESLYENLEGYNTIADSIDGFDNTPIIYQAYEFEGKTYKSYTLDVKDEGSVTFLSDGKKVIGIPAGDEIKGDRETLARYNQIIFDMISELRPKEVKVDLIEGAEENLIQENGIGSSKAPAKQKVTPTISSTSNSDGPLPTSLNKTKFGEFERLGNDDLLEKIHSSHDRIVGMLDLKTYLLREMDNARFAAIEQRANDARMSAIEQRATTDARFDAIEKAAMQRQIDDLKSGRGPQFGGGMMGLGGMSQGQIDNLTTNLTAKSSETLRKDVEQLRKFLQANEEALRTVDPLGLSSTGQNLQNTRENTQPVSNLKAQKKEGQNPEEQNLTNDSSNKTTILKPAKEWPKLLNAEGLAAYLEEGGRPKMKIPFAGDELSTSNPNCIELRQDGLFVAVYKGAAGRGKLAEHTEKLRESLKTSPEKETSPEKKVLKTSFIELRDDNYDPRYPDKNTSYCIVRASGDQVIQSFITAEEFKVISEDHKEFYNKFPKNVLRFSETTDEFEKLNSLAHDIFIKNCVEAIKKGLLTGEQKAEVIGKIEDIEYNPSETNYLHSVNLALGNLTDIELAQRMGISEEYLEESSQKKSFEAAARHLAHEKVENIIENHSKIVAPIENLDEAKKAALKAFTGNPKNDKIFGIDHLFSGKKELQQDLNDLKIPNSIYPKVSSVSISRDVKNKNKVTICFDRGKEGKGDDTAYIDVGKGYYIKVQQMKEDGEPGKVGADGKPCAYEKGDIKYFTGEVYKCIQGLDGKTSWSEPISTKASLGSSIFGNDALINDSSNETASKVRKNIKDLRIISVSRSTEKGTVITGDQHGETPKVAADVTKLKISAFVKGSDQSKAFVGKNTKRAIALGAVVTAGLFSGGVIPVAAIGAIGAIQVSPGVAAAFSAGGPLATFFGSTIPAAFAPGAVFGAGGAAAGFFGSTIPAAFAPGAALGAGGAASTFLGSNAGIATAVTFGSTALVTGGLYKGVTDLIMQPVKGLKLSGDLLSDSVKKDSNKEKKGVLSKLASTAKDKMDEIKRDYKEFKEMNASDKSWSILRNVTAAPFTITGVAIGAIPVIVASTGSVVVNNVVRPIGEQFIGGLRFGGNILKAGAGTKLKAPEERAKIVSDMISEGKAENEADASKKIDQALKGSVSGVLGAVKTGAGHKVENMQKAVSEFLESGTKDKSSFAKALITAPVSVPVNVAKAGLRLGSDSTSIAAGALGTVFGTLAVPLTSFIPTFCKPIEQVKTVRGKLGLDNIQNINSGGRGGHS